MTGGVRRLWWRLVALFRHSAADDDLRDEIQAHLALAVAEHVRRGASPAEARRLAALELGGVDAARERHRDARSVPLVDAMRQDLTYAVRGFRRDPGFTVIAVTILALGIGANTAVFSVVNPLLLRELPLRDASRLVWITNTTDTGDSGLSGVTHRVDMFEDLQRRNRSFERIAPYFAFFGFGSYKLVGDGRAERVSAVDVGPGFFELLGVQPAIGRLFTREELSLNGPHAVLLTHGFWERRFGADRSLVGRTIVISDTPYTVTGVLPADFDFASVFTPGIRVDVFVPAVLDAMRQWGNVFAVVGRLRPGVTVAAAQRELDRLMPEISRAYPQWGRTSAGVVPLEQHVTGRFTRALTVLWGAVGLVLLIVCVNLANLLLARTAGRRKELAVRMALGAGRGRVVRQLLTEGILLSLAGAALGVLAAQYMTSALRSSATLAVPLLAHVRVDAMALTFTIGLAALTGLAFGILPALRVSSRGPQDVLKEQGRGATDGRRHVWLRSALVVGEVALACVLLVGAGLLLRSFLALQRVELGFEPTRAFAVRVDSGPALTPAQAIILLEEATRRVAAIPQVQAVGLTDALPLDRNRSWPLRAVGQAYAPGEAPNPFVYIVGPGYFDAMGIPIRAGRDFSRQDASARPRVVIVNETLARRFWPGQQAVGRLVELNGDATRPVEVIGVVADVRQSSLEEASAPQMYFAHTQFGAAGHDLVIRSTLAPGALASAVRATLGAIDRTLVTSEVRPIEALVERAASPRRFLLTLIAGFSLLALLLACLGIYGVVAYGVTERVQEIGVRMALGATALDVCRLVLGGTLRLAAAGVGLGLAASLLFVRVVESLLYGTSPTDVTTFGSTAAILLAVGLAAAAVPAIRAAGIAPMTALRTE
jgi:predicted permease